MITPSELDTKIPTAGRLISELPLEFSADQEWYFDLRVALGRMFDSVSTDTSDEVEVPDDLLSQLEEIEQRLAALESDQGGGSGGNYDSEIAALTLSIVSLDGRVDDLETSGTGGNSYFPSGWQ